MSTTRRSLLYAVLLAPFARLLPKPVPHTAYWTVGGTAPKSRSQLSAGTKHTLQPVPILRLGPMSKEDASALAKAVLDSQELRRKHWEIMEL